MPEWILDFRLTILDLKLQILDKIKLHLIGKWAAVNPKSKI